MTTENTIIAVIEPDIHPQIVVERAAQLARRMNCDLELLLCDPDVGPLNYDWLTDLHAAEIAKKIGTAQAAMMDDLSSSIRNAGISITTNILDERPIGDALLEYAEEKQPKMLLKGTQFHSASERSIFVHTDWQLVRSCPCPLYLVKERPLSAKPKICAAVDPMHSHDKSAELDQTIVQFSQGFAAMLDGEVHLVHTYSPISGVGNRATRTFKPIQLSAEKIAEKMKLAHREKLDALADSAGIDGEFVHQLPGRTHELVPMFVRTHGVDIVVMGGLARWGVKRAIIGSSVERMMDHLPCDALIVRADNQWSGSNKSEE